MPFVNFDVFDYGISVLTSMLMMITLENSRKDRLAVHVKLDDLEKQIDSATTENAGIEELSEDEIKARKV